AGAGLWWHPTATGKAARGGPAAPESGAPVGPPGARGGRTDSDDGAPEPPAGNAAHAVLRHPSQPLHGPAAGRRNHWGAERGLSWPSGALQLPAKAYRPGDSAVGLPGP